MRVMGLGNGVHWVSWFVDSFVVMMFSSGLLSLLLKVYYFLFNLKKYVIVVNRKLLYKYNPNFDCIFAFKGPPPLTLKSLIEEHAPLDFSDFFPPCSQIFSQLV